jgi:signal peptidase I
MPENANLWLYGLAGVLTLLEVVIRWILPSFRKNPANANKVETVDSLWIAIVVALSLKAILLQPFTIPSGSMEDTLLIGDYILVNKFEYGYSLLNKTPRFLQFKKPQRREILVFVFPGDHSKDYIKRCVGLPGDVLEYKKKELFVNGVKQDEPYVKHIDPNRIGPDYSGISRDDFGPITVAPGHYFMMGDNRDNSADSRYWGQLDEKLIKGRAWVIYWHSVGYANFFALLSLVVAFVSIFLMGLAWRASKTMTVKKPSTDEEPMTPKKFLPWIVVSLVIAGGMITWSGSSNFKGSLKELKSRIFTVVK